MQIQEKLEQNAWRLFFFPKLLKKKKKTWNLQFLSQAFPMQTCLFCVYNQSQKADCEPSTETQPDVKRGACG